MTAKARKLSPAEVEVLRKLENELQLEQRLLQKNLDALKMAFDQDVMQITKQASEKAKQAAVDFNASKRQLDLTKSAVMRKAEKAYQEGLTLLHLEKSGVCSAAENWLLLEKKHREGKLKEEVAEMTGEFQKLMEDNKGKQQLIKQGTENG